MDGYVRVSQVAGRSGDSFISPSVQREQIEAWGVARGLVVGEIFEELDESGARADRPLLEEAVRRVERGESGGVVVAKIDRFGRSLADGLAAIERVTEAGGVFASVQDGLDLSTDTGRLVLRIMLSMGEWELDRVRANWATARGRAIARGVCIGVTPFGYRRRSDGRLAVDRTTGPLVTELFRLRADGASLGDLRDLLEASAAVPPRCLKWRTATVRNVLANRVYLGELRHGEFFKAEAHPPLTDPATWVAAQRPVQHLAMRDRAEPALLRGILRCAGCRRLMTTSTTRVAQGRTVRYSCHCDAPPCPVSAAIRDTAVEPLVEALFWQELPRLRRARATSPIRKLEAEVARHEQGLASYRDNPSVISTLGAERFEQGLSGSRAPARSIAARPGEGATARGCRAAAGPHRAARALALAVDRGASNPPAGGLRLRVRPQRSRWPTGAAPARLSAGRCARRAARAVPLAHHQARALRPVRVSRPADPDRQELEPLERGPGARRPGRVSRGQIRLAAVSGLPGGGSRAALSPGEAERRTGAVGA